MYHYLLYHLLFLDAIFNRLIIIVLFIHFYIYFLILIILSVILLHYIYSLFMFFVPSLHQVYKQKYQNLNYIVIKSIPIISFYPVNYFLNLFFKLINFYFLLKYYLVSSQVYQLTIFIHQPINLNLIYFLLYNLNLNHFIIKFFIKLVFSLIQIIDFNYQ